MIVLNNFSIGFSGKVLMSDVNATFPGGELTAVVGRNGSGKTTLLKAIAGQPSFYGGNILIDGIDLRLLAPSKIARLISFVGTERLRTKNMTATEAVSLGRSPYTGMFGRLDNAGKKIVEDALDVAGAGACRDKMLDTLSDGELQRVLIARSLAQQTDVIVLDEPTTFLDVPGRRDIFALLQSLARNHGKTVIFSTHEVALAEEYADNIALVNHGMDSLLVLPTEEMTFGGYLEEAFS